MHYFMQDHLGSTRIIASASGTIVREMDYYPFGGERVVGTPTVDDPHKFAGMYRDAESGLYHTRARMYSPELGRWLAPDFLGGETTDPNSLNRYAYVGNNPTNFIDPLGLDDCVWDGTAYDCGFSITSNTWASNPSDPQGKNVVSETPDMSSLASLSGFNMLAIVRANHQLYELLNRLMAQRLAQQVAPPPEDKDEKRLTELLNQLADCPQGSAMAEALKGMRANGKLKLDDLGGADGNTSFFGTISIDRTYGINAKNLGHEYYHGLQKKAFIQSLMTAIPILPDIAWQGAVLGNAIDAKMRGTPGFGPLDMEADAFGDKIATDCHLGK